jgi:hypothetical protein
MDSYWGNIYDNSKDRRYGRLFLGTFLALLGFLTLGALICGIQGADNLQQYLPELLLGFTVFTMFLGWMIWRWIRFELKCRKERLKHPKLSRDELAKARLKLRRGTHAVVLRRERKPARLVPRRQPDMDLKY